MTTLEVAEKKWEQFCGRIQEFCHGAPISIRVIGPDGTTRNVFELLPLVRIALDENSDPCNARIFIEAGLPGERPTQHVVIDPIHIRLKDGSDNDRYNHLHILAENGTTIIDLNPGINPGLLKDLNL
jgi:hypothetical protein